MKILGKGKFYRGDCLKILRKIPSKSIDLILIDPPYGITAPNWDKVVPFDELWKHYNRVLKKSGVIAIFSSQPFTTQVINSNPSKFKYCWYWIKNVGTNFFHAKRMPIRKVEEICIFGGKFYNPQITNGHRPTNSAKGSSKGKAYHGTNKRNSEGGVTTRYPTNILNFDCVDNYSRLHSSQKPIELIEYLIKTYTKEGMKVLDSFAGSGTTAVACENTNRKWVCIEKDLEYFKVSLKRVRQTLAKAAKMNRKR